MTISIDTQNFANALVATEEHMRRALKALAEEAPIQEAQDEIEGALKHARGLPRLLIDWTASDDVQNTQQQDLNKPSHIDMMAHICGFGEGLEALMDALALIDDQGKVKTGKAIGRLTVAMGAICGAHLALKQWCLEHGVCIPYIATTRSGGGR